MYKRYGQSRLPLIIQNEPLSFFLPPINPIYQMEAGVPGYGGFWFIEELNNMATEVLNVKIPV